MASQFYKRYIPPPIIIPKDAGEQRPFKKRKKTKTASSTSGKLPQSRQNHKQDTVPKAIAGGEVDDEVLPVRNQHPTVFAKYDSALGQSEDKIGASPPQDEPMTEQENEQKPELHGLEPLPQPAQAVQPPKVSAFSALPGWLQSPMSVSATDTVPFAILQIDKGVISALQNEGYASTFAIQSALLPMLLPGPQHHIGDICVSAATGSGKTLAYVLPMVQSLRDRPVRRVRGLVVVPTRELVNQVRETLKTCSTGNGLVIGTAVGSRSLKEEQAMLVHKGQKYDPRGYKAVQEKEIDEDEELMDWDFDKRFGPKDDFELYYNHVVEYRSNVDILICTPGRLVEHVQSTTGFTLEHVQWLVIDEADRLLDESFQQWVDVVLPGLDYMPPMDPIQERLSDTFHLLRRREVQKVILSATMTRDVSKLTPLKLRRPRLVILEGQQPQDNEELGDVTMVEAGERFELPTTLHEVGVKVSDINEKPLYLIKLLLDMEWHVSLGKPKFNGNKSEEASEGENSSSEDFATSTNSEQDPPFSAGPKPKTAARNGPVTENLVHGTLIFTKTNEHATRLARLVSLIRPVWSQKIATLTKSSASSSGKKTLIQFRKNQISILIASDRASRGLDIPDLAHVINYDMPSSVNSYIHRVGRTARARKEGKATTLIADNEARWFWNEIARNPQIGRGSGRKVIRNNSKFDFSEEDRVSYQRALTALGQEAQGGRKGKGANPK